MYADEKNIWNLQAARFALKKYLMVHGYNEIPIKFQLRNTFAISCVCYFSASMADKLLKRPEKAG
jgi:hypothetical protein